MGWTHRTHIVYGTNKHILSSDHWETLSLPVRSSQTRVPVDRSRCFQRLMGWTGNLGVSPSPLWSGVAPWTVKARLGAHPEQC